MGVTSKTGLLASTTKKLVRNNQANDVNLKIVATAAPYALKPLAGIYNPYPYGCSLLCNHPADTDARELLKRAKDTWANEERNLLLSDEVDAIRASLNQLHIKVSYEDNVGFPIENVPEELFRRYTETDSRPLTPTPTLVSAHTRASGSRRCVTPDPMLNTDVREKTQLILDLRRSHSQETFSWHGSIQQHEVIPVITVQEQSPCTPELPKKCGLRSKTPSPVKNEKTYLKVTPAEEDVDEGDDDDDDSIVKRRGRKRRKRGRDSSRGPPAFQSSLDPETQIAMTIGPDSHNPSARPSLVPLDSLQPSEGVVTTGTHQHSSRRNSLQINSFLDLDSLKLLRRELDEEVIDNEFNLKRRKALEEAMRTIKPKKVICKELEEMKKEFKDFDVDENFWLNIPRVFSRTSARFELPMDSRILSVITPLKYVAEHVSVSKARKQLYNHIFNLYKTEDELESEHQRVLPGKNIILALNEVMSNSLSEEQKSRFSELIGWKDEDNLQFKTFCGLAALCERLLAPEYPLLIVPKRDDPCHEIETIDFKSLEQKLKGQNPDERIIQILYRIRDS